MACQSILVILLLEWSLRIDADIVSLVGLKHCELGIEGIQMQPCYFLVQDLGEFIDSGGEFIG